MEKKGNDSMHESHEISDELDLAISVKDTSWLGCQITVNKLPGRSLIQILYLIIVTVSVLQYI